MFNRLWALAGLGMSGLGIGRVYGISEALGYLRLNQAVEGFCLVRV